MSKKFTIALSGLPGSGSTTQAIMLSRALGLRYFSVGDCFKAIGRGRAKKLPYYSLLKQELAQREMIIPDFNAEDDSTATLAVWASDFGKDKRTHLALDEVARALGIEKGYVVEGKLALYMVKDADLKVWLEADFKERAERRAQADNMGVEKARGLLRRKERAERRGFMQVYGLDCLEQKESADLVVNTTGLYKEQVRFYILRELANKGLISLIQDNKV